MKTALDHVFVLLSNDFGWLAGACLAVLVLLICAVLWRKRIVKHTSLLALLLTGLIISALLLFPYALNASRARSMDGPHFVQRASLTLPGAPLTEGGGTTAVAASMDLWFPATGADGAVTANSCADLARLPLAAGESADRKIILYMPHFKGGRDDNSARLRWLAAQGYIVLAFDDIGLDPPRAGALPEQEAARLHDWPYATQADYDRTVALNDIRAGLEAEKALRGLSSLAACDTAPWNAQVDYDQVAFMGFSFGGAAAAEAALLDPRIAAVVGLDSSLFGQAFSRPIDAPYLYFMGTESNTTLADLASGPGRFNARFLSRHLQQQAKLVSRPGSAGIHIENTVHGSFTDAVFEPHASRQWLLNDPNHTFDTINAYILEFLDHHLHGKPAARINQQSSMDPRVQTFRDMGMVPGGDFGWPRLKDRSEAATAEP